MEINEFAQKVCSEIGKKLGKDYQIKFKEVKRNNGVVRYGLLVLSAQNIAPIIYLNDFWEAYHSGMDFTTIIDRLLTIYWESIPKDRIDMEFFSSFEKVKDRICYYLVEKKGNEELLSEMPYIEFLNLAVCFYYAYQEEMLGEGRIFIHNSYIKMWDTCAEELYRLAQNNTPKLFLWECNSIEEVLNKLTGMNMCGDIKSLQEDCSEPESMYILSNEKKIYGAACILYPGVLERLASKWKCNLYILPSSIHEVILLTDRDIVSEEKLKEMIIEINATEVVPEEVLSNSLYYYDLAEKMVKMV